MTWLEHFNRARGNAAVVALLAACASPAWARAVTTRRPYPTPADFLAAAAEEWWRLPRLEWLQAFAAHPRIGERAGPTPQPGSGDAWSAAEQSAANASPAIAQQLADINRVYEQKFGHIYIVCATGKTADEMLRLAQHRIENDADTELRIAAGEQARITRLRLEKLLVTNVEEERRE